MRAIINGAASLTDMLWDRVGQDYKLDDPASRAAFFQELRDLVRTIGHNQTRQAYADEIEFRISSMRNASDQLGEASKGCALQWQKDRKQALKNLTAMLALLISHPERIADHYEELSLVDFAALTGDFRLEEVKKEMLNKVIQVMLTLTGTGYSTI